MIILEKLKKKRDKEYEQKYLDEMKRFREELVQYGLRILEVGGDGNCLFRSICDQLEGCQNNYKQYRIDAVDHMLNNRFDFEPFIEDDVPFDDYIEEMEKDGEWGGNLEIQALSIRYQFNVIVHQLDAPIFGITNFDPNVVRTIHLTYHLGEHYNSVRLADDFNNNEPPEPIPLNLKKDPALLEKYLEEQDSKMKTDAKRFKDKHIKEKIEKSKSEEPKTVELADIPDKVSFH